MRTNLTNINVLCAIIAGTACTAYAQIDPAPRQVLQVGANQSLRNDGPMGAYAFYYWNMPHVPTTNETLRLVIAPGYVDSELGFNSLLGPHTDLGIGAFGGLYANSYQEIRGGNYYRDESFDGNGGGGSVSIYHRFNPDSRIPLNGMVRGLVNYKSFNGTGDTGDDFKLPTDQPFYTLRTGLRWGGKEPMLGPRLAMELSVWYALQYRPDDGNYGYASDPHDLESMSHQFLGRAQINFTTPESHHYIMAGLAGGSVIHADRFSAGRVGGVLPFTSEFPLYMPGFFDKELSVQDLALAYGLYSIPLGQSKQWNIMGMAAGGWMDYVEGMGQPGHWNTGVGGGVGYKSLSNRWRIQSLFGYGITARRSDGTGGYSAGFAFQYNFGGLITDSDRAFQELEAHYNSTPTR
jgi:hypothetical protein